MPWAERCLTSGLERVGAGWSGLERTGGGHGPLHPSLPSSGRSTAGSLEIMSKLQATYSVVLRADLPPLEREMLELFCGKILSRSGESLLHFNCTRIDASHHAFLEMETFGPDDTETHPMRIPYHYIFLISGDQSKSPPGFLTGKTA